MKMDWRRPGITGRVRQALERTVAGGVLVAAVGLGLFACGEPKETPETTEETVVRTVDVRALRLQPEEVEDVVSLPADLLPTRRAVLAAEVAGTVERLLVEEGQTVRSGALLATIDTRALEQEVAEAEAVDRRAKARHQRAAALFEKRSITQQQLLDAVTDRDVAEARLASARLRLEKSRVKAPWAGEVSEKKVEVGDYAVPGQALFELIDTSKLKVRAPAPASDVPYLEVGAPVTLHVEGASEAAHGTIVRLAAELDSSTRTLDVEAEIPNGDGRLRSGLFGRLEVVRRTVPDALLVPLEAVVDLGGRDGVFVIEDGVAHRREVELGTVLGERAVVRSGLEAGDRVVTAGQDQLGEGQPVEAVNGLSPAGAESP